MSAPSTEVQDRPDLEAPKRRLAVVAADVLAELTPTEMLRALLAALSDDSIALLGHEAEAQIDQRGPTRIVCDWCTSREHAIAQCPNLRRDRRLLR